MRRRIVLALLALCSLAFAPAAFAGGGSYTFTGGTEQEQATVTAALEVSSFNWNLIPRTITIHIGSVDSYSTPGHVYLDSILLDSGRFSWGVVQHEMAHQVGFLLFDDADRAQLLQLLGGKDWCYGVPGLKHSDYGCERFASELAWAYWPSPDNTMRPAGSNDEATGMPVAQFRAVLARMIGAPSTSTSTPPAKAYAPTKATKPRRRP